MFDVLNTCVQNPKPSDAGAEAWAVNYGRAVGNSGVVAGVEVFRSHPVVLLECG